MKSKRRSFFQDILKFQNVIIDQTDRAINKTLSKFLKEDVKKMHETKECVIIQYPCNSELRNNQKYYQNITQ